jgi:hypothetical protein
MPDPPSTFYLPSTAGLARSWPTLLLASIGQIKTTLGCAGSSWSHPLPPPSAPLAELALPRHTCAYVDLGKKEEEGDDSWDTCAVTSLPYAPVALCRVTGPSSRATAPYARAAYRHLRSLLHTATQGIEQGEGREEGLIANFMPCWLLTPDATSDLRVKRRGMGPTMNHL